MIQRAELADPVAMDASARIAEAVRAWRIVLFGSRARGTAMPDSDYDFYVEVDAEERELPDIDRRIRHSLCRDGFAFDLKLVRRGSLERRGEDPGMIEWDVVREGKLLFADPAAPPFVVPRCHTRVREPLPEMPGPPESVAQWIEAAERDERHAGDLWQLRRDYWPEICWLSQQMCEKLLKALLVSRIVRPERTHDLGLLLRAARERGIDLGALDAECELLTKHAITPRYPAGGRLTEGDARDAFAAAARIAAAVRTQLTSPPD